MNNEISFEDIFNKNNIIIRILIKKSGKEVGKIENICGNWCLTIQNEMKYADRSLDKVKLNIEKFV